MKVSRFNRILACFAMTLAMGITLPGVVEASGAKARSTADRRQRPGAGYFANSPQNRAPVQRSAPTVVRPSVGPQAISSGQGIVWQTRPGTNQPVIVRRNVTPGSAVVSRGQVVPGSERVISERVLPSTATAAQPVVTTPAQTPVSAPQKAVESPQ